MKLFQTRPDRSMATNLGALDSKELSAIRFKVARLLAECGVPEFRDTSFSALFIGGEVEPKFSELTVDSLILMEIGIAVEDEFGVSLSPIQLSKLESVQSLVFIIGRELH